MKPIIFNSAMVRAILDGRKTETRRVIKPQPNYNLRFKQTHGDLEDNILRRCPDGKVGDKLWVRETFKLFSIGGIGNNAEFTIGYKVSGNLTSRKGKTNLKFGRFYPSIHMPKWASRIILEITDIKVERVQDITEEGAKAEGIFRVHNAYGSDIYQIWIDNNKKCVENESPINIFIRLWDSINEKKPGCAFNDNPFVWRIKFKRLEGEQCE